MAYYLGRDVDIAITTESAYYGVGELIGTATNSAICLDFRQTKGTASTQYSNSTHGATLFAGPRHFGDNLVTPIRVSESAENYKPTNAANNPWTGTITGGGAGSSADVADIKAENWTNVPANITGLDLSFGVMDEDVAFVGQRNVLKAEIKKDNSVTLTRKKSDSVWNTIYNDARFGLIDHDDTAAGGSTVQLVPGAGSFHQGLTAPDYQQCGYRVYLRFGGSTSSDEIFVRRNCYITDYSVTMGADSSQEESITFQTYVDPIIQDGDTASIAAGTSLQLITPTAEL